jgi:PadR family transcriptional regulator, regulatory protein AphA
MRNASLPTSSYVVLGLLATWGPMTPYQLKKAIDGSIGYFWSFPRAQLYVEPERLEALGLLTEEREPQGRRRRTYHIAEAGRAALREWLISDLGAPVELRDPGLLKLYFGPIVSREEVIALAHAQEAMHRARLAEYERIEARLARVPQAAYGRATLHMGLRYEQQSIAFWADIAAHPPEMPRPITADAGDAADAAAGAGQ